MMVITDRVDLMRRLTGVAGQDVLFGIREFEHVLDLWVAGQRQVHDATDQAHATAGIRRRRP